MTRVELPQMLHIGNVSVGTSNIFVAREVAEIASKISNADEGYATVEGVRVHWQRPTMEDKAARRRRAKNG